MKLPKKILFTSSLAIVGLLSACSNGWTEAQKASITSLGVSRTEHAIDAYTKPNGTTNPGFGEALPQGLLGTGGGSFAGGAAAGAIGSIIGQTIDGITKKVQQNSFEKKNGQYFSAVRSNINEDFSNSISQELAGRLKADSFLRDKVKTGSVGSHTLNSKLIKYGYARVGKDPTGEILMLPYLSTEIAMLDTSGKALMKGVYTNIPRTENGKPLASYAGNKELVKAGFTQALQSIADQFSDALRKKTGSEF